MAKEDRGEYRAIYATLVDSREFRALSGVARACFWILKMKLGQAGIDVFYIEALPRLVGFDTSPCEGAVQELIDAEWLAVEGDVYWLRNGLRFEPSDPLASPNGRKGVENHLKTLPKMEIVNRFAAYYGLEIPFPDLAPSKPLRSPFEARMTEEGIGKRDTDTSTPRARASGWEDLAAYLGDHAGAVERLAASADHGRVWPRGILGLYGPDGTDPQAWGRSPPADRPQLLAAAMDRLATEGKPFNGKFFRRILLGVIDERGKGANRGAAAPREARGGKAAGGGRETGGAAGAAADQSSRRRSDFGGSEAAA